MSTALTELNNPLQPTATVPSRSAALDLNIRQKSFVDNLIQIKVGWRAAELAGYSGDRFALSAIASENLKKPNIRAYYEERLAEMQVSSSEVLAELGEMARYDVIANGKDAPIRAVDKLKALELAGKYHRLFVDKVETETTLSDADIARLGSTLLTAMIEASQRMRAEQASTQLPENVGVPTN